MEPNEKIFINVVFWKGILEFFVEVRKYKFEKKAKYQTSKRISFSKINVSEASQLIKELNLIKRETERYYIYENKIDILNQ